MFTKIRDHFQIGMIILDLKNKRYPKALTRSKKISLMNQFRQALFGTIYLVNKNKDKSLLHFKEAALFSGEMTNDEMYISLYAKYYISIIEGDIRSSEESAAKARSLSVDATLKSNLPL